MWCHHHPSPGITVDGGNAHGCVTGPVVELPECFQKVVAGIGPCHALGGKQGRALGPGGTSVSCGRSSTELLFMLLLLLL